MKLTPEKLAPHLAKSLAQVYLVAGEEPLLMEESLDAIRAAGRKQGYGEREVFDVERGFDWSRVIEACGSMSLFASRKMVEIRMPKGPNPGRGKAADEDSGSAKSAKSGKSAVDGAKLLTEIAQNPPADVLLIVSAGKLDYRQQKAAWVLALESAGASVYARPIAPERWNDWVAQRMRNWPTARRAMRWRPSRISTSSCCSIRRLRSASTKSAMRLPTVPATTLSGLASAC